jgi:hypothetical protein
MAENTTIVPQQEEPSFFQSVKSGIGGFIKGIFAGGTVGAVTGAVIGAAVAGLAAAGAITIAATALGAIGTGALIGAVAFGAIGSFSGMTTEVVKSRQKIHHVSGQDVLNVANIAFAQGITVGHEMTVQNAKEGAKKSDHFRKMVEERRAAAEQQQAR